jgi:hypothetical protein
LICFGANGVNVFQGTENGVTKQIKEIMFFILLGPLYGPPHQFGSTDLIKTTFGDLASKFVTNLAFILCPFT